MKVAMESVRKTGRVCEAAICYTGDILDPSRQKYYVDLAAQSGFEYMLIDAGWSERDDVVHMNGKVDVPEVVRYAKAKNVGVWIWAHSKAVEKQMDDAFPLYEKWGVVGVKTDFVERDDQHGIEFYYRSAEAAAKHHLMIDYHGATKPTGIERMWANIMGYEGVLGMEWNKGNARDNPVHEVTLPFTHMLAGPMDYTPGAFNNVTEAEFEQRSISPMVRGTRAHRLAMYVIYEAAFQMVSDAPTAYKDQPAFEFIRTAPAAWDETEAINGNPAEYVTLARRKGNQWFLGSMTNWTPRDLDISLTFLGDWHISRRNLRGCRRRRPLPEKHFDPQRDCRQKYPPQSPLGALRRVCSAICAYLLT